jgi:hypothetical protein
MTVLTPIDQAVQALTAHPNALRLKKLLIYACKNNWEGDPQRIACFNLKDLIQELLAIAPTPDQLQGYLFNLVETINKKDEYRLLAQELIELLRSVYASTPVKFPSSSPTGRYLKTAQALEHDPEFLRIKKLLFCACQNTWENNPSQLARYGLMDLVQELHHLAPSIETLDATLRSIVKTLNRQEVYRPIADRISNAFQPLYTPLDLQTQFMAPAFIDEPGMVPQPEEPTGFANPQSTPIPPPAAPVTQLHSPTPAMSAETPTAQSTPPPVLLQTSDPDQFPHPDPVVAPYFQRRSLSDLLTDLFDLRLEIMKYTNTLRAKVLLFSIVHAPPNVDYAIWSVVSGYDLDDLLRYLFQSHRVFSILESTLKTTAQNLPDSEHYRQAADAILRVMYPYYNGAVEELRLTAGIVSRTPFAAAPEDADLQSQPLHPSGFSHFFQDDDNTGQLIDIPLSFGEPANSSAPAPPYARSTPEDETAFRANVEPDISSFQMPPPADMAVPDKSPDIDDDNEHTQANLP